MERGDPGGGSSELARLIDEHGEFIVSDLKSYQGVEPWQIIDGTYSPRLILAFIKSLPVSAASMAAIQGGQQFRGWGVDAYLTALAVDAIQENTYAFVTANSKKGKKVEAPKPVERPSTKKKKEKSSPLTNKFAAMARMAYGAARKPRKDADGGATG